MFSQPLRAAFSGRQMIAVIGLTSVAASFRSAEMFRPWPWIPETMLLPEQVVAAYSAVLDPLFRCGAFRNRGLVQHRRRGPKSLPITAGATWRAWNLPSLDALPGAVSFLERCKTSRMIASPRTNVKRRPYGRGAGVGRGRGVGVHLPVHGVGVGVGVPPPTKSNFPIRVAKLKMWFGLG